MKTTLVITGAGFSADAGLPLEADVVRKGHEICQKYKPDMVDGIIADARKLLNLQNVFECSIEEILTRLKIEEVFSKPARNYVQEILPLEHAILDLFSKTLYIQHVDNLPTTYLEFVKEDQANTAFATFNNDLLLELVFEKLQLYWTYTKHDGLETPFQFKFYHRPSNNYRSEPEVIPYLKLHGSFNWHYCWKCHRVRISSKNHFGISGLHLTRRFEFMLFCTECGTAELLPLIIPPTLLKYYELKFIQKLWIQYDKLLRTVEKVIIIGSSLRDEDTLFLYSLMSLRDRNPKLQKLIFVNPDRKLVNKVQDLTNLEVEYFSCLSECVSASS